MRRSTLLATSILKPISLLTILLLQACVNLPINQQPAEEAVVTPISNEVLVSATPVTLEQSWTPPEQPVAHTDVWDRVRANYRMDIDIPNKRIKQQRDWYLKHKDYISRVSVRGAPYIHYIAEQIEVRGIPGELAMLPIVESAFDAFAYSHGRASGVWQFIPSTGRYFGLKQDWWHDGRRDIRASTNAALDYLTSLSKQFDGDWLLALASYNAGAGNVRRAIKRNIKAGRPTDYWSLNLPKETENYVPRLIALAQLLRDPQKYGVKFVPVENTRQFAVASTGGQIDLSQVATLAGAEMDDIYRLNPQYNRWATHPDGPHEILLPVDKHPAFVSALASLPAEDRLKWHRYVVKSGDNLGAISRRFRTTTDVIRSANNLRGNLIRIGQTLMIPGARHKSANYSLSETERKTKKASARQPKSSKKHYHTIKKGDTLWSISRKYGVKTRQLTYWNSMAPGDPLTVGKSLVVYLSSDVPLPRKSRQEMRKINYAIRRGDSLSSIASRFKVSVRDIKRWNPKAAKAKYLQPGQKLVMHVNVMR